MSTPQSSRDPYTPQQIAQLVGQIGVMKAKLPMLSLLTLGMLAGAFIAFGGLFYTFAITGSELGFGPTRMLGGLAFSLGLILVVVGGAELFTGNNSLVMAWAEYRVSAAALLRNWALVYVANFVGALLVVALVLAAEVMAVVDGAVIKTAISIAEQKIALDPVVAFSKGVLCNVFVCLAIWLCLASHSVSGKVLAIVFPISAFVTLGLEHCVANMYLIPIGMWAASGAIDWPALAMNLLPVTLGNMLGGGVLVALVYWVVYLRVRT